MLSSDVNISIGESQDIEMKYTVILIEIVEMWFVGLWPTYCMYTQYMTLYSIFR